MAETSDSDRVEASGADSTNNTANDKPSNDTGNAGKKAPVKCQACTSCRQKKVRCDGGKPTCAACQKSGADCQYVPSRRRGRPARAHREYERPYVNPQPILPRQPRVGGPHAPHNASAAGNGSSAAPTLASQVDPTKYQSAPALQLPPNRVLPTLPHLQPSQSGQGRMPPPAPTAPLRTMPSGAPLPPVLPPIPNNQHQNQQKQQQQQQQQQQNGQHKQQSLAPLGSILAAALFPGSPHSASEDDGGGQSGHRSSGSESPLPRHVHPPPFLVPAGERGGHQTMAQATPLVIPPSIPSTHSYMDPNIVEFFHYFNALFPIVHWPSFKEAYDDGTVPNYLVLAIRALSKRYSKQPSVVLSGQLYAAGQDLAAIATSLAEAATREDPNTYLIQTWIILSMFEFGMGRMKQAADRRELAVRLAYQLDLSHIEVRASQRRARSLIVAENCRRVWWSLFYADRYFSLVSSDPGISPAIHESTYRVGFPRVMREATPLLPPRSLHPPPAPGSGPAYMEFPRYIDHDVILWFQSAIPLSLIMGHVAHQCRAAEQLFRNGLAERPVEKLWEDPEWLDSLSEFVKNFLVIDAEITQWRQQLNAATTMSVSPIDSPEAAQGEFVGAAGDSKQEAHSTRDVTLFHREVQYHGLVVIHQCLALYSYEKLRLRLSALASACTPLLWLESTATQAWKKVVRSADFIRSKTNARATELANARASASGTMSNGAAPEPEWELCVPHMPFLLYLSAKVHVCQYHWQKIALARVRAEKRTRQQLMPSPSRSTIDHQTPSIEPQVTPSFVQPFSQPASAVGTPNSNQEGWASSGGGAGSALAQGDSGGHATHNPSHHHTQVSADMLQSRDANTPVMTTSGAAALAAAQAAAAAAAVVSRHTTPQSNCGGSSTHLYPLSNDGSSGFAGETNIEMADAAAKSRIEHASEDSSNPMRGSSANGDAFKMNIDDVDEPNEGDVEVKLSRRVETSKAKLDLLLRLLATCQEYWADHDYVQLLRDMVNWPDEWTTSMHMLERLLLELRID
ncbi:hypothetical protein GGI12_000599 [Dipsacomyces acuminosporus]|nr:hypothetical protein GGI12_000599 [Dipsacomyces acuminosporus]